MNGLGHRRIACEKFGFPSLIDHEGCEFFRRIWNWNVLEFSLSEDGTRRKERPAEREFGSEGSGGKSMQMHGGFGS
jgi:hypothetical protein